MAKHCHVISLINLLISVEIPVNSHMATASLPTTDSMVANGNQWSNGSTQHLVWKAWSDFQC